MRVAAGKNKRMQVKAPRGFSLIELLIVVAIILIIAAIAIPNLLRSRQSANQASAVANLRTISTASVSYWVSYGNGYPPSLAALGGAGAATCDASILLDPVLTTAPNRKSGYQYAYTGEQGNVATFPPSCTNPGYLGYLTTAVPISLGTTGINSYCTCEPGIIHMDTNGGVAADENACNALPTIQ
jgi:type IV pilus assembly protein PilA